MHLKYPKSSCPFGADRCSTNMRLSLPRTKLLHTIVDTLTSFKALLYNGHQRFRNREQDKWLHCLENSFRSNMLNLNWPWRCTWLKRCNPLTMITIAHWPRVWRGCGTGTGASTKKVSAQSSLSCCRNVEIKFQWFCDITLILYRWHLVIAQLEVRLGRSVRRRDSETQLPVVDKEECSSYT
jgi:hypothetical protein